MITRLLLLLGSLCLMAGLLLAQSERIDFVKDVKPILASRCVVCHQSKALFGQVNLENATLAFKNRPGGPAILRDRPDSSPLYYVLRLPPKNPQAMPPTGHRIPDREAAIIHDWIKQGAPWPQGPEGVIPPPKDPKSPD